jgi:hypothetical protein
MYGHLFEAIALAQRGAVRLPPASIAAAVRIGGVTGAAPTGRTWTGTGGWGLFISRRQRHERILLQSIRSKRWKLVSAGLSNLPATLNYQAVAPMRSPAKKAGDLEIPIGIEGKTS